MKSAQLSGAGRSALVRSTPLTAADGQHERAIAQAKAEGRILLTRGGFYVQAAKQLGEQAYHVQADETTAQVAEILRHFHIEVVQKEHTAENAVRPVIYTEMRPWCLQRGRQLQPTDLFSRCLVCNGQAWVVRAPADVRALPDHGSVPLGVLDRLEGDGAELYQCGDCGKFYWEGRHINSAIQSFFGALLPAEMLPLEPHVLGRRVPRDAAATPATGTP